MNFEGSYKLEETVKSGVWRTLKSGLRVRVASIRTPSYKTCIHRLRKQYADLIRSNDEKTIKLITCKAMAETILLDWDNATDPDGNPIPYTPEVGEQMLAKYEIFMEDISSISSTDDNYLAEQTVEK